MIKALTETSVELITNDRWFIEVEVQDDYGNVVDETPTITVTSPTGVVTTPTVERYGFGRYRTGLTGFSAGRYVAVVTAPSRGATAFTAWTTDVVTGTGFPTVEDVRDYDPRLVLTSNDEDSDEEPAIGLPDTTDGEILLALMTEASHQRKRCNVPAAYPPDLAEALLRSTHILLSMRSKLFESDSVGDAEAGVGYQPFRDPVVRRLESPYRKVRLGL